jgi:hypothetical protein
MTHYAGTRLYRGLKGPYRVTAVPTDRLNGTDFTNCPYTALSYAATTRGVVVVLDVPSNGEFSVTEELWPGQEAKRLMVWGRFDRWVLAVIAAKELRAEIRRKGMRQLRPADKGLLLRDSIARRLGGVHAQTGSVPRPPPAEFARPGNDDADPDRWSGWAKRGLR